jgi:serine/threonine-protein kinase
MPSVDLERGALVAGKYRLDRPLGEGGMGVVWAATHTVTGKSCALKFLKDEAGRERFLREARAACAIRHPNVAPVHDVLEAEGRPLLVMDLLDGEPLSRWLARAKVLSIEDTARVMVPVIDAVLAIHEQGIVHRDLKPDNVFITRTTNGALDVKVLDFGIAKITGPIDSETTPALTKTGTMMGTPYYMAPEQIFGDKDVDVRADVWALGVMLYECLAGSRPTEAEGVGQVVKVIATDAIVPLDRAAPGVPLDLAELDAEMLSRNKEDRPALYRVRDALAKHLPSSTQPPAAPSRIVHDADASPIAPTRMDGPASARDPDADRWPATPSRPASGSKRLLWTAIMVGCSGLGLVAFFVSSSARRVDQAPGNAKNDPTATAAAPPPTPDPTPVIDTPPTATVAATVAATTARPTASVATNPILPDAGAKRGYDVAKPPVVSQQKMPAK